MRRARYVWPWLFLALVAACGPEAEVGDPCSASSVCGAELTCAFGRCRIPCASDAICRGVPAGVDAGAGAVFGRCVVDTDGVSACTLPGVEQSCSRGRECPSPLVCAGGECRNRCEDGTPCADGAACVRAPDGAQICEWAAVPDAGLLTDAALPDATLPLLDSGSMMEDDGGVSTGWPADFPTQCIPPAGELIGHPCERDTDCATGVCDPELLLSVAVSGAAGGYEYLHSPGGTCVASRIPPPIPREPGACGPCGTYYQFDTDRLWCVDRCAREGPLPNGGCRPGYRCDQRIDACVPGCRSDDDCRLSQIGLDPSLITTCDLVTGTCSHPDGGIGVGDPCSTHHECDADLFCAREFLDLHTRGVCRVGAPDLIGLNLACPQWPGICTRNCATDADCGSGAVCALAPHYESLTGVTPSRVCLRECTVGAEPPEDRIGAAGSGLGCATGLGCYGEGVCAPGVYTSLTEANVGARCSAHRECWSPYGLARCGDPLQQLDPTCRLAGCDDPTLGAEVCPADGVCTDNICRRRCSTPEDCEGGDGCIGEGATRACDWRCSSDADCRSETRCVSLGTGPSGETLTACLSSSGPAPGGCGGVPVLAIGTAAVDSDGWQRETIRVPVPGPPSFPPCGGEDADAVGFTAPTDGLFEIQVTGAGQRLAGILDTGDCFGVIDPRRYACRAAGDSFAVRLRAFETISFAIVGVTELGVRSTAVAYRFTEEAGIGEPCGGAVSCGVGLRCATVSGVDRCVPQEECGADVPVGSLSHLATPQPDGSLRVFATAIGDDVTSATCGPGSTVTERDLVLRHQALGRQRWVIRPALGTVSTRGSCTLPSSETGCAERGSALVFDVAAGETFDLLSEAFMTHDLFVEPRQLVSPGGLCDVPGRTCDRTSFCKPGFFLTSPAACSLDDLGCGPGVDVSQQLGTLAPGVHLAAATAVYAPPPAVVGGTSSLCAGDPRDAVAVFDFTVDGPSSLSLLTTARAGADSSPTWSLRDSCNTPVSLPCGRRLFARDSPILMPGTTYYLVGWHQEALEGPIELVVQIDRVRLIGETCGGAMGDCGGPLVCDAGICRVTTCGDGTREAQEQCDDGGTTPGDGCDSMCRVEGVCGDGRLDPGEGCDDNNDESGDGCDSTCTIEPSPGSGGDTCADRQRLTSIFAGELEVFRGRADSAGATDAFTPNPVPGLSCTIPTAVDRSFVVRGRAGEYVRLFGVEGRSRGYYRYFCPAGPDLGCGSSDAFNFSTACVGPLPFDADITIVVEPDVSPYVFDLVAGDCEVAYAP